MIIESLSKEARKELKYRLKNIYNIDIKVLNRKGFIEPKNIEIQFLDIQLNRKVKAVRLVREALKDFRLFCFEKGI